MNSQATRRSAPLAALGVALLLSGCSVSPSDRDRSATQVAQPAAARTEQQLAYAMAHWNDYNTAQYGDLNPVGGDCANFVSQTLIARGWQMNSDWYNHDAAADWSPAWGYVPAMDAYFRANAATLGLTEYPLDKREQIRSGDIVMFDWDDNDSLDHVQIVSRAQYANGAITIQMAGHNEDTDYRDLDHTITVEHPRATGHFWRLSR